MLYKRGEVWWYEFQIEGQRIRESSCSPSKVVARDAEKHRREQLVESINGLNKRPKAVLFSVAAKDYLLVKGSVLRPSSLRIEQTSINHLTPVFGGMLLVDINGANIAEYQRKRRAEGAAAKTVNLETGTLRAILKRNKFWAFIQEDVKQLRERTVVGKALTPEQETALLAACAKSRSRSLYPAVVLALSTGLRRGELLNLRWGQVDLLDKTIQVGDDAKTEAGAGRIVPLNAQATAAIEFWAAIFPDRKPEHAVFPTERVGAAGDDFLPCHTETDTATPVKSIKEAWERAKRASKVYVRWHDLRHTFCTRLLEQGNSFPKVGRILGWSDSAAVKMGKRYGHIGQDTLRAAVETLDPPKPVQPEQTDTRQTPPPAPQPEMSAPTPATIH